MIISRTLIIRTLMVIFWMGIISAYLYTGRVVKYFKPAQSINVFMWSGVIDPKMFQKFKEETGIHVNVSYYEGNEELLVKLLATKARGYDMVVPSDYVVQFLVKHDLLHTIDRSKLDFWNALNPKFMGHYFDPHNKYSIPAEWYLEGLGVNTEHFKEGELPEASWASIFDPEKTPDHIGLFNDSRELSGLAVKYLYGKLRTINAQEVQEVKKLLQEQKKKVEAYTDFRGDFLLESGNCSLVTAPTSFWKTLRDNPNIIYLIPKEGTFLNLENYVIPKPSQKADLVYKFWNFLFRLDVQEHNFNYGIFLSTRKDAGFMFDIDLLKTSTQLIHPDVVEQAEMFENKLTDEQINEIWLGVKGS
ncbi:MAG: spermidine/putrescine-binding protein [Alteromonas naphthalenivorans]|jgi:spermidine/putrescine-binding protein